MRPVTCVLVVGISQFLGACEYGKLLRPRVLKQLDPDVAALVNELPEVDAQNEAIIGRLFVHGGLSHAQMGPDRVMRDTIEVPPGEFIWEPAVIVMAEPGELELVIENHDTFLEGFAPDLLGGSRGSALFVFALSQ